jgi:hypothetical protein
MTRAKIESLKKFAPIYFGGIPIILQSNVGGFVSFTVKDGDFLTSIDKDSPLMQLFTEGAIRKSFSKHHVSDALIKINQ